MKLIEDEIKIADGSATLFFLTAKIWRLSFASNFFKNPMMKKFFSAATVLIFEMCFETIRCEIEEGLNERVRERE